MRIVATNALALIGHLRCFDEIGDGAEATFADPLGHAMIDRVLGDAVHDLPVDLEKIYRQALQVHE